MSVPAPDPVEPQGYTIAHLLSALPSFILSAIFLITWIAPEALGEKMISWLMLVMLLEFINVHAAGFMGNTIISDGGRGGKAVRRCHAQRAPLEKWFVTPRNFKGRPKKSNVILSEAKNLLL